MRIRAVELRVGDHIDETEYVGRVGGLWLQDDSVSFRLLGERSHIKLGKLDFIEVFRIGKTVATQFDHEAWAYKGWTFTHRHIRQYAIHGPNSKGLRARKIVLTQSAAMAYIDERVKE